jgi:uncharacterized protein YjbI with pentapeptide repeats
LLVVPLVLSLAIYLLNDAQAGRDRKRESQRIAQQDRIAREARLDDTLRSYLDQVSGLQLDHGLGSRHPEQGAESVAQALTLAVLRQLDGQRKGMVVQFLVNDHLIENISSASHPTGPLNLDLADLRGVVLADAQLGNAFLAGADLRGADLRRVFAERASFRTADLRGARLNGATLDNADFASGDLRGADLTDIGSIDTERLGGPIFTASCLSGAKFRGADLTASSFREAEGHDIDFTGAVLEHVNFAGAHLTALELQDVSATTPSGQTLPAGWNYRGEPMSPARARRLCSDLSFGPRG